MQRDILMNIDRGLCRNGSLSSHFCVFNFFFLLIPVVNSFILIVFSILVPRSTSNLLSYLYIFLHLCYSIQLYTYIEYIYTCILFPKRLNNKNICDYKMNKITKKCVTKHLNYRREREKDKQSKASDK